MTILTVLTYRHGHFGPAVAGPLRRLFPSPLQSNWRLYVRAIDGRPPATPTVLFLANIFDGAVYALGTRLFSDVMLAHHGIRFEHRCGASGWTSGMAGGDGSAPSLHLAGGYADDGHLPERFATFFADSATAVARLTLQDAAIAPVADAAGLAVADIDLPIDPATATPLSVACYRPGALLRAMGATDTPFCFHVPAVRFRALGERLA